MTSPLQVFRKNQKWMLVVFGIMLMFAFLVADIGVRNFGGGGRTESEVVVSWKGGQLTDDELARRRVAHNQAVNFLSELVREAQVAGGRPRAAGVYLDESGRLNPGIPADDSNETLARIVMFAEQAERLGISITNEAVLNFLEALSDGAVLPSQYQKILREVTGGRMNDLALFETLKTELLAQRFEQLGGRGGVAAVTPGETWQTFERLNRRVTIEAVAVPVADFVDQVTARPTMAELQAFYERYKNEYDNPNSPEPGFRRRPAFAFGYFKAEFDRFVDAAAPLITDEEILAYYEENKDRTFRAIEPPTTPPSGVVPPETATPAEDKPAEDAPAEDKPAEDKPAEDKPAEDAPAAPPELNPATQPEPSPAPAPEGSATPAPADEQSSRTAPSAEVFTLLQEEEPSDPAPAAAATPAAATPADAPPADAPASDTPASDTPPAADTPEETPPATETPAAETAPADAPAPVEPPADAPPAPKYKPLAEVSDQIRRILASPRAQEKMMAALDEAEQAMRPLAERAIRLQPLEEQARDDKKLKATLAKELAGLDEVKPDFAAIAARLGLSYGEMPLADALAIQQYELGRATQFIRVGQQFGQLSFVEHAFDDRGPYFRPARFGDPRIESTIFLYWKTDHRAAYTPSFSELHDVQQEAGELLDAWRMQQALEPARAAAEKLAEEANKSGQPLAELSGLREGQTPFEAGPFSWYEGGSTPFGGGGDVRLGFVDGVAAPGEEFMLAVYSLPVGKSGVAVNQPHTVVYVVRVVSSDPDLETLRSRFADLQGNFLDLHRMAQVLRRSRGELYVAWRSEVEKDLGVEWRR